MQPRLILASQSPYRRELFSKLGLAFTTANPNFDEEKAKKTNMAPLELAQYLALGKARSLRAAGCLVVGGDQMVAFDQQVLGKPGSESKAVEQLQLLAGKTHILITAMAVVGEDREEVIVDQTVLKMRDLSLAQIKNYVKLDQPFDCAGSYKIERSGLSLFERIDCKDFSAIQGLPLIELTRILTGHNFIIPGSHS